MGAPAWLWIRESGAQAPRWLAAERELAAAGFESALVELDPTSDRSSLVRIDAALRELGARAGVDDRRLGVIGLGLGGTLALQAGCTSRRVRAVVGVAPLLVYPELSAARPIQPVELVLNLDVPLLALLDDTDPRTPPEDVELFRRQCELGAKNVEFERVSRTRLDEALPRLLAFAEDALG
jgi:dienelactone hydrolase